MTKILQMNQVRDCRRDAGRAQVACSQCSLGEICLPKNLSSEEMSRFEQIVQRSRPIHAGQHIFRSGDEFKAVASVRTGCFKSYAINKDGQEQVLGFYLPGEIIGFDAIHEGHHVANVVALDTSAVCSLPFGSVSSLARTMPDLQQEIFRVMSLRISELETIAGDLSADQRIALFLKSLSSRFARRGYSEREFILAMSRRDIASYLRLATETVSRVLARFQQRDLIEVDRKLVKILDMEQLQELTRRSLEH